MFRKGLQRMTCITDHSSRLLAEGCFLGADQVPVAFTRVQAGMGRSLELLGEQRFNSLHGVLLPLPAIDFVGWSIFNGPQAAGVNTAPSASVMPFATTASPMDGGQRPAAFPT